MANLPGEISMKLSGKKSKNHSNPNVETNSIHDNEKYSKGNLLSSIFNDLKHPVHALSSLTNILLKELQPKKGSIKDIIDNIDYSSQKIKGLISNLFEWVKSQLHSIEPNPENISVQSVLDEVLKFHLPQTTQKSIKIFAETDRSHMAYADLNMVSVVIKNIVAQSIKLSTAGGQIFIKSYLNSNNESVIHFHDCGMNNEMIYQILGQDIQKNEYEVKSDSDIDLGLLITKELVKVNNGRIEWKVIPENGSSLNLIFPSGKPVHTFSLKNVGNQKLRKRGETKLLIKQLQGKNILLLNLDAALKSSIEQMFPDSNIHNASIQSENIENCFGQIQPDLIISGLTDSKDAVIASCKLIKSSRGTFHIPFIFINENSSDELYLEGLKAGADACILKPFEEVIFLTKIKNIFDSIERSKLKFSLDPELIKNEATNSNQEDGLLQRVAKFVEANISNPDLCGNLICKEIGISKSLLYLKLKDLTGQTVNEFIRIFRLKMSTKLLLEGKMNIAQISSEIGFNSPSYFTRSFAQFYGMPPKEYVIKQFEQWK